MRKIGAITLLTVLFFSCQESEEKISEEKYFVSEDDKKKGDSITLEQINKALDENPDNMELLLKKGRFCRENLDFICARDAGAKAYILDSTNIEARSFYAWTLVNRHDPPLEDIESAKRHYKYVLSVQPNDADILVELANTYSLTGDFETSFKFINDALKIEEEHRDAYVLKGSNYRVMGNMELALSSYQTAVQVDPEFYMGFLQIAYLLTEQENHKLALEYYRNALELDEESIEARYGIAMSLQDLEEYEEAQSEYRAILEYDPDFYFSYFNQGFIKHYYVEELDSAVYYYNRALDLEPESVKTWHNLGEVYFDQDRRSDAARAFAKALSINPDYEPSLIAKEKLR